MIENWRTNASAARASAFVLIQDLTTTQVRAGVKRIRHLASRFAGTSITILRWFGASAMSEHPHASPAPNVTLRKEAKDVSRYIASPRTELARNRDTVGTLAAAQPDAMAPELPDRFPGLTRVHRLRSIGILVTALWLSVTLITSAAIVATTFFL